MGMYINPGNDGFKTCVAGDYIDKTGLIAIVNSTIGTKDKLSCVSRARRFGKSMAAQMLCAYYDKSCDSRKLFQGLEITKNFDYDKYLNKYNVLYIDVTSFIGEGGLTEVVNNIRKAIIRELAEAFSFIDQYENVVDALGAVVESGEAKFIAIIDEWDAVIRDRHSTNELQYDYLEFLRSLFKSSGTTDKIFDAAYMTGILPIKKDGSQSAISEFREYTMLDPGEFAPYFGFNEDEVKFICEDKGVDFSQMKKWYDGYSFKGVESVYNPNSVIYAAKKRSFKSYWQMSSSARSLEGYINMDFDGLADTVVDLLGGRSVPIKTKKFQNDLTSLQSKDDVLTLLTHFGYLAYDDDSGTIRIPNEEIREEFADMVHDITHVETLKRVKLSDKLIEDVINMNEDAVADAIEEIHRRECTPLHYNNEQSLRTVIKLGFFAYRDKYLQFEELPSGNGYADIVYMPIKYSNCPVLVIELKWDKTAISALDQIKDRHYPEVLKGFDEEILLVGISYDKDDESKKHYCKIERILPEIIDN